MTRVVFTFDACSYETLQDMVQRGKYDSPAACVRECLQVNRAIQEQAKRGFTEVLCRDPETGLEKQVVIPSMERVFKRWQVNHSMTGRFLQKSQAVTRRLFGNGR